MENHKNIQTKSAPLASLAAIVPSLESTPAKTPDLVIDVEKNENGKMVEFDTNLNEKMEVTFKTRTISSSSSYSSSSSSSSEEINPKIPEGGWGWVVVFASMSLSMIADGIAFSIGHLQVEFKQEFEVSDSIASWIGSLFFAVPLLTGPIMSALVNRFGCRIMTCAGGVVACIGFALSAKAQSIGWMYLTFGVIAGIGVGVIYVTMVVSVTFWFEKKRTLAIGIGASGTGLGTCVFAPLSAYLVHEFGWRGCVLILGGAMLNMCVCGVLMRDPDWILEENIKKKKAKSQKSSKTTSLMSVTSSNDKSSLDLENLKNLLKEGKDAQYILQSLETSIKANKEDDEKTKDIFSSVLNLPTFIKENEKVPIEVLEQLSTNKRLYNIILENYPSLILCRSTSVDNGLNKITNEPTARIPVTLTMKLQKEESEQPIEKPSKTSERKQKKKLTQIQQHSLPEQQDIAAQEPLLKNQTSPPPPRPNASFPRLKPNLVHRHNLQLQKQHYLKNLKLHRQSLVQTSRAAGALFNVNKYRFKASSCPNIYKVSMMTLPEDDDDEWYTEIFESFKTIFGYSLFLELHFFLLSISTITLFIWFIVPYFFLAELMPNHGYTTDEVSTTIANFGVTNTIGMVLLGWAGDQSWMNVSKTFAVCMVFCGLSIGGMMFFIDNFILLQICASIFGLSLSSHFSFTPAMVMELLPLEKFTMAYGLQLMCMGIGTLVGPPYAGLLYDLTKTWEQSFYQSALWIILSGVLLALIPYTKNRKLFGKGALEKEDAEGTNSVIWIVFLLLLCLVLCLALLYMTILCFL